MSKKVYLAGPMSGYADYNFPAFHAATEHLRKHGYEVFSPAEADLNAYGSLENLEKAFKENPKEMYKERLEIDLLFILQEADAIALLPGWTASKGANAEFAVANAIGLEVIHLEG